MRQSPCSLVCSTVGRLTCSGSAHFGRTRDANQPYLLFNAMKIGEISRFPQFQCIVTHFNPLGQLPGAPVSSCTQHRPIVMGQWKRRSHVHPPAAATVKGPGGGFDYPADQPFNGPLYVLALQMKLPDHME